MHCIYKFANSDTFKETPIYHIQGYYLHCNRGLKKGYVANKVLLVTQPCQPNAKNMKRSETKQSTIITKSR